MTFDELFKEHNLTIAEREALVTYLATLRAQATLKALMPVPVVSKQTPPRLSSNPIDD